jgi:hypothetical protein
LLVCPELVSIHELLPSIDFSPRVRGKSLKDRKLERDCTS